MATKKDARRSAYIPLNRKVTLIVLGISTCLTSVMTTAQVAYEYYAQKAQLRQKIDEIERTNSEAISESVWNFNKRILELQLDGIMKTQDIVSFTVYDDDGKVLAAPTKQNEVVDETYSYDITRVRDGEDKPVLIGKATVNVTHGYIKQGVLDKLLFVIIGQFLKATCASLVIMTALAPFIIRPLRSIMDVVNDVDFKDDKRRRQSIAACESMVSTFRKSEHRDLASFLAQALTQISDFIDRLKENNAQLEAKVAEKTEQLRQSMVSMQSMFNTIELGIFTFADSKGLAIEPEYSVHLPKIFGDERVAGRNAIDYLFRDADTSEDARRRCAATLDTILHNDDINFAANEHNLIREAKVALPSGQAKWIELDWVPMVKSYVVEKMMVVVRDVTSYKQIQQQSDERQRQVRIMMELMNASTVSLRLYFEATALELRQAARALNGSLAVDVAEITGFIRIAHTLKGNARTVGLIGISDACHQLEDSIATYKGADAIANAKQELTELSALVADYGELFKRMYQQGRDTSQKHEHLREVERIVRLPGLSAHELRQSLQEVVDAHDRLSFRSLVAQIEHSLPSYAKRLVKPVPALKVSGPPLWLDTGTFQCMLSTLVHVTRNSIDHGIESEQARLQAGKAAAGTIAIEATAEGGGIELLFSDDGGGLDLARLREKATAPGASDEELAETIFLTGVSTATAITEISGRGIGLDAVRALLQEAGGTIALEFTGPRTAAGRRPFRFRIRLLLPAARAGESAA